MPYELALTVSYFCRVMLLNGTDVAVVLEVHLIEYTINRYMNITQ